MGFLIDTSVLIAQERGAIDLSERIGARGHEPFWISVISASELLYGVHRARGSALRRKRAAYVDALLERLPILPIDLEIARVHARLWADLADAGTMIGAHDLWLAASALARDHLLVTRNIRECARVGGLEVEEWR